MRLVTFLQDGQIRLGALVSYPAGQRVLDLNWLDPRLPADIVRFLTGGPPIQTLADQVLAAASPALGMPLADVALKAPIPRPGKIICIGQNYLERVHRKSVGRVRCGNFIPCHLMDGRRERRSCWQRLETASQRDPPRSGGLFRETSIKPA